jgi:RND family efflux transporter MFP subunit
MRRSIVLALFAGLVLVLLWFQGILFRHEHPAEEVPGAPEVEAAAAVVEVERVVLPTVRTYPGFVEPIEPAAIAARVMANVVEVTAREGDAVAEDAVLARLDAREATARLAQARASLRAAEARAEQAELAFARADDLRAAEASTEQQWEAARAERDAAAAQVEALEQAVDEAETTLGWYTLTAPFASRVLERHADPGELALPGQPLLRLYRADSLRLAVACPEELAAGLELDQELELHFDRRADRSGRLLRILPPADPGTGTVTLHIALDATGDLRPGQLGRLVLTTGEREALFVPVSAVERVGQIERVQRVEDGRRVTATVRTGKRHGDRVEITSGLRAGDRVVLP